MQPFDFEFLWSQLHKSLSHPEWVYQRLQTGNLVPFREITQAMRSMTSHSLTNLIGNVVIFIPFGFFIGVILHKRGISAWTILIYSLAMSLFLEGTQLILRIGQFDVDDLLLNTLGGVIGGSLKSQAVSVMLSLKRRRSHEIDFNSDCGRRGGNCRSD